MVESPQEKPPDRGKFGRFLGYFRHPRGRRVIADVSPP